VDLKEQSPRARRRFASGPSGPVPPAERPSPSSTASRDTWQKRIKVSFVNSNRIKNLYLFHIWNCALIKDLIKYSDNHQYTNIWQIQYTLFVSLELLLPCSFPKYRLIFSSKNLFWLFLGVRPFACTLCDKTYGRRDYLQRHLKSHNASYAVNLAR